MCQTSLKMIISLTVFFTACSCPDASDQPLQQMEFDDIVHSGGTVVPGIQGNALQIASPMEWRMEFPQDHEWNSRGAVTCWMKVMEPEPLPKSLSLMKIAFDPNLGSLVFFKDNSRLSLRFKDAAHKNYFDANLPVDYWCPNKWFHLGITWDFTSQSCESFIHVTINGNDKGLHYTLNDQESSHCPDNIENLTPVSLVVSADGNVYDARVAVQIDALHIYGTNIGKQRLEQDLTRYYALPEIVLEESVFSHFTGKLHPDDQANDRHAWTTDPTIASSPPIVLDAGEYSARITAYSVMETEPHHTVAGLLVVKVPDGSIIQQRHFLQEQFSVTNSYTSLELAFELEQQTEIRALLKMMVFGYHDFFLKELSIDGTNFHQTWDSSTLLHSGAVMVPESDPSDGLVITNGHALLYGPYIELPLPGLYDAVFRLKIDPNVVSDNIATLDVFAHDGRIGNERTHKVYASFGLTARMFEKPGTYQDFYLPFLYDGAAQMEFRVLSYCIDEHALSIDRVLLRKRF